MFELQGDGVVSNESSSRYLAVEPGKSTYVRGNPFLQGAGEAELKEAWAATAGTVVLTGYHAGWSPGQNMHTYEPHVLGRQSFITRISHGFPRAAVVGNGGKWTIQELNAALSHGFPAIIVNDTGRFAALANHLFSKISDWSQFDIQEKMAYVRDIISENGPLDKDDQQRLQKDMSDPDYQEALLEFMRLMPNSNIRTTKVDNLEAELREMIK
jgi:hypothetical protein